MSGGVKAVLSLVVLAALVGGGWYLYKTNKPAPTAPVEEAPSDTAATQPVLENLITSTDTSDAGLAADVALIDAQISAVSKDSAAVDAGMSDKQITQ